ncbi:MAG: tetratricopeptide repeat protein [Candidatus Firestonebacteria bacterium]
MKKIIILILFLLTIGLKLYLYKQNTDFNEKSDFCLFRVESAIRYHYAKLVAYGENIPKIDTNAQYPEGLKVKDRIKLTTEYITGILYQFIPNTVPFHVFLIYFMFTISSITVFIVYLISFKLSKNFYGSILSCLFYITAFPSYARTVAGGFVEEDFALPFIFLSFLFFLKSLEHSQKYLYPFLCGLFLFIPLTSWHLTQFYFTLFLIFIIFQFFRKFEERDKIILPFLFIISFNILGGIFVPTLNSENFLFSYNMLISYSLIMIWIVAKHIKMNKWISLVTFVVLIIFVLTLFSFLTSSHKAEYSHVYSLVLYKIIYFGKKPDDPSSMPFDAKVFWQAGFLNPSLKNIIVSFGGIFIIALFGIILTIFKFVKNKTETTEEGLLYFVLVFLPLYLLFERLYVFLIFFMAPYVSLIFNLKFQLPEKTNKIILTCILFSGIVFQSYSGFSYDIKIKDADVHNDVVRWLKENTKEEDSVLANFGFSASIFTYSQRPIVLHPMFESKDIRDKTKECYEAIFNKEEDFYKLCKKYKIKIFIYDWHYILDKSKNSIRYQINQNNLFKESVAFNFHFYPERLKHFSLLYQNTYYRVYKVNEIDEKPYVAQDLSYKPFFNPKIFVLEDNLPYLNDEYTQKVMEKVWDIPNVLNIANLHRKQKRNDLAEIEYKKIISIDPYFPEARVSLAEFYLSVGRYKEAIQECKIAVELNEHFLDAYYFLSQGYCKNGEIKKAIEVLKDALKIAPNHEGIKNTLLMLEKD